MNKRYLKNELARDVLGVVAIAGLTVALAVAPGLGQLYKFFKIDSNTERRKIYGVVNRLRKNKYIIVRKSDGNEVYEITALGRKKLQKFDFDNIEIKKPKKWDKKWRIVIFDIPEKKKLVRDSISIKLKEMGFYPLQKSTFIYPYDCEKEITIIKAHFYLNKELSFIVADFIDNQKELVYKFGIV